MGYPINFDFKINFSEIFNNKKNGFDIVIANPPYVRHEEIKEYKPKLKHHPYNQIGYSVFSSTADLYTYFYELSYNILNKNGFSMFISSNKWMRAKYGENLRKFFKKNTKICVFIDFAGHQVFDTATVDTNILMFQKETPNNFWQMNNVNVEDGFSGKNIAEYIDHNNKSIEQNSLQDSCWTLVDDSILKIKKKIEACGIPLKEWDLKINRGILTGCNEAFIIDTEIKERLCKEDPKYAEIIKPILRGRDIGTYQCKWAGKWIITTFPSMKLNINHYPSIKKYLKSFGKKIEQSGLEGCRKKTPNEWFETQDTISYYLDFENEKIVWQEIVYEPSFYWDNGKYYQEATSFIMIGKEVSKYLLALLNSKLLGFVFKKFYGTELANKATRYKKTYIEQLAVPKLKEKEQKCFINLVEKILILIQSTDYISSVSKQQ